VFLPFFVHGVFWFHKAAGLEGLGTRAEPAARSRKPPLAAAVQEPVLMASSPEPTAIAQPPPMRDPDETSALPKQAEAAAPQVPRALSHPIRKRMREARPSPRLAALRQASRPPFAAPPLSLSAKTARPFVFRAAIGEAVRAYKRKPA